MSELQYGKIPELEKQLEAATQSEGKTMRLLRNKVTDAEIAEVLARWTGIPVARMLEGERKNCCVWNRSCTACDWSERSG
jgi:ATP-dependent Clp protease ATP-binding subunit ClpB